MITREILVANSALAGLTEDQINAIITINNNDVAGEIGKKTSEIYQKFDQLTKTLLVSIVSWELLLKRLMTIFPALSRK